MKRVLSLLVVLLVLQVFTLSVRAQSNLAVVETTPSHVSWRPLVSFERMSLRVSGPEGYVAEAHFRSGQPIMFRPFDRGSVAVPQGTYVYEIRTYGERLDRRQGPHGGSNLREAPLTVTAQSGFFTIDGSGVVPGDRTEPDAGAHGSLSASSALPIRATDQVIPDDMIVQQSLCVGFDCVDNESFGTDTIRMKENNTRLKFDDTSSANGFAANDWQLTANDQPSGGANRFSIEDITGTTVPFTIMAGASTNALFVSSAGDLGLRTATPGLDVHMATSDTPAIRFEQTGSGGFTPQTWDIGANEANFFVRDLTGGSRLSFRIRPGAPTSSIDINAEGKVGIGTAAPSSALHVYRNDGNAALLVDEQSSTSATRNLVTLSNNGPARILIEDRRGYGWRLGTNGADFINSMVGGGMVQFRLSPTGDLTIPGNLTVGGSIAKASGSFKIDHPLDPANRYLYHSFVESPDMMNIYNGNVSLDENGEAWVEMPEWFDALNSEFRYQLTPIGGAAPGLHVAGTMSGNRFRISGGTANGQVSWQVTGVRNDPYSRANRIPIEEDKPLDERGTYLFAGYESGDGQREVAPAESDPATVIAAKNGEIRDLRLENEALQQQLAAIDARLAALETERGTSGAALPDEDSSRPAER